jgi:hypothetical protein
MVGDEARVMNRSDVGGSDDDGSATMDCTVRGGRGLRGSDAAWDTHYLQPNRRFLMLFSLFRTLGIMGPPRHLKEG